MSQLNKRGVSLMIGYVLLIAMAIALSSAVFFYLKLYLPDERPECDSNIRLTIDSATCVWDAPVNPTSSVVEINVTNRGLFKIEGAYIKIGDVGRAFKKDINPTLLLSSSCNDYNLTLNPGKTFCGVLSNDGSYPSIPQEISVQPVVFIDNKPILCSDAVVTKRVICTPS